MIRAVIRWSVEHRGLVVSLAGAAALLGLYALRDMPVDALPDLQDPQLIVFTRWDRPPEVVEAEVTHEIVTALLGTPDVEDLSGASDFGFSYVHVRLRDGADRDTARRRVQEALARLAPRLPPDAHPQLGPDATGLGWIFQYALVDETAGQSPAALRRLQDETLRPRLQSVPGVAEVASVGGFETRYRVTVDPARLAAYGVSVLDVLRALRATGPDAGGRVLERNGREYMTSGDAPLGGRADIESVGVRTRPSGIPVLVRDVAAVSLGPAPRRGVTDLDGRGDVVAGIVVMRDGENARAVIGRVKERLAALAPTLPAGVHVVTTYDRSALIDRGLATLRHELVAEIVIVSLAIFLFLWHVPSAIVPIVTMPVAVLLALLATRGLGLSSNIMSLSGIALSIGVLVDGAIVEVENAHKKMERWTGGGKRGDPRAARLEALLEVGPPVFFSLLVIAIAFLPLFTLTGQEGRLFRPLAWTKTLTMLVAALLAVTLDPALRTLVTTERGRYRPEEQHPLSRALFAVYEPVCRLVLRFPRAVLVAAGLAAASGVWAWMQLGHEFMPPLHEGTILYMPTTPAGLSTLEARRLLQLQDRILSGFPEVERVFGKAGRAGTATDPAPLSMMETTITLRPDLAGRADGAADDLVARMDRALQIPGLTNAWTMPIKGRIDMLATGFRTPVGLKISGPDPETLDALGRRAEALLRDVPGTRSVYAERATGGDGVDFRLNRGALAQLGLSIDDAQDILAAVTGGRSVAESREDGWRIPVVVQFPTDVRESLQALATLRIRTPLGAEVPLARIATARTVPGPAMIRDENGLITSYVYVDVSDRDLGGYVARARAAIDGRLALTPGYSIEWSGQYEGLVRVREHLRVVVPLVLAAIVGLLYLNTRSWTRAGIVLLAVPFSLIGAAWLLYTLGYEVSVATWVGVIALLGLDAETGVFMLLFLDLAYDEAKCRGRLRHAADLHDAIVQGAVKRVRPKVMTVIAAFLGLMPIMASGGTGSDVMKRIAAPMVGGLASSFLLELLVYPAVYLLWRRRVPVAPGQAQEDGDATAAAYSRTPPQWKR